MDAIIKLVTLLRDMTKRDLYIVIFIVTLCGVAAFWIEQRYANLVSTQTKIEQQQTEIIQLQMQILNVVNALPADVRKDIVERSAASRALSSNNFIPPESNQ